MKPRLSLGKNPQAAQDCYANQNNEFVFSVDFGVGNPGYYKVEGCEGTSPTLKVTRGVQYTIVQDDDSNWFHPVGLAYYPDGALGSGGYAEVPELEEPTPEDCDLTDFQCNPGTGVQQAPLYGVEGTYETIDNWNDGTTGGLDVYEPIFQRPLDQWQEQKPYGVRITIPTDSLTAEFFYFCHIHAGMSGRIEVEDPPTNANALQFDLDPSTYYVTQDTFDMQCGTFGASPYQASSDGSHALCPDMEFICDARDDLFSDCMRAIDCKMMADMRVTEPENNIALFMMQMIPHHENAINMAKILLKEGPNEEGWTTGADDSWDMPGFLYSIINKQAAQVGDMQAWLDEYGYTSSVCPWTPVDNEVSVTVDNEDDGDEDDKARALAIVGIVFGAVGLLTALMAIMFASRSNNSNNAAEAKYAKAASTDQNL